MHEPCACMHVHVHADLGEEHGALHHAAAQHDALRSDEQHLEAMMVLVVVVVWGWWI